MKVSICIPAYKNPEGIRRLLKSILEQDYTDFEVIVTDDTPGDEVSSVISEFKNQFDSLGEGVLRYIKNEVRLGPSANWNHSIALSNGEYTKVMHHDDWFSDNTSLGKFVKMLDDNPNSVLAFCGSNQVDINTGDSYSRCISDENLKLISDDWRNIYLGQVIGAPSATIYRKTNEEYDGNLTWIMDIEFLMRIFKVAEDNGCKRPAFTCTKDPLVNIGTSSTQLTEAVRDNADINVYEYGYIMDEFGLSSEKIYRDKLISVALEFDKTYDDIKKHGISREEYNEAYLAKKAKDSGDKISLIKEKLLKFDIAYIGKMSFYVGLLIEVMALILEKSAYINPYESWMFRISFGLFLIKCITTKYTIREYIAYAFLGIIAVISYLTNTKDEVVRIVVFIAAMKNMDLKRTMKFVFKTEVLGIFVLMILSLLGILGTVFDPWDGFGIKAGSRRLCLGLGSANTFAIMVWALMVLGIYIYHEKMRWWHYVLLTILSLAVYVTTYTRTTLLIALMTIASAFIMSHIKVLQKSKIIYSLGAVVVLASVGFSAWAAKVSNWHGFMTPMQNKIDDILTGRIESIYAWENGGGVLKNWLPFSNPDFKEYFDMGFVRMFFWYGMVPGIIAIIILFLMIRESYRRNDYMGFIMIIMFIVFTVVEAHIVSVYIARNYLLILAGSYMSGMVYLKNVRQR